MMVKLRGWALVLLLANVGCFEIKTNTPPAPADESSIDLEQFDTNILNRAIKRKYSPANALGLLFGIHANEILKNDFYCYTYPFVTRDITTYPSLSPWTPDRSILDFNIFVQNTHNAFPYSNGVQGYLNVFNTSILQAIDNTLIRANGICIPTIINLLQEARVERWRVGFLCNGWKRFDKATIGFQLPLYATANHYNFPLDVQHELRSMDFGQSGGACTVKESALYPYVVESQLGLGDLVLNAAYDVYHADNYRLTFGATAQLPTAIPFSKQLIGTDFQAVATRGHLNLGELVEEAVDGTDEQKCAVRNTCITFGKQFVYYMGAILLPTDLGQDDRTQLGIYVQPIIHPDEKVSFVTCGRLDWFLPKILKRSVKNVVNCAEFADDNFNPDKFPPDKKEEMSTRALNTLDARLTDMLFPANYCLRIASQLEAQFTFGTKFQLTDAWSFLVGYDYWYRSHEYCTQLGCINVNIPTDGLQTSTALRSRASQSTIFLQGSYVRLGAYHDFSITLCADLCMVGKGIGQDMTGVVTFEWKF